MPSTRLAPPAPDLLLDWYDHSHRSLPWRTGPADHAAGRRTDAYRVWLSEIMLQQTTVAAVIPYFTTFTTRWPSVAALAAAPDDDILSAWAGLGYYSRARNLIKAARMVTGELGGQFPDDEAGLRALPGVGPYTAAAIAAIAFDRPVVPVDGNVERVTTRLFALADPLPGARPKVGTLIHAIQPKARHGDFAQGLMDLGATICTPRSPACPMCPWTGHCLAEASGTPTAYPVKAAKPERPTRLGIAYVARRADGAILLRRRADKGLLGGMTEVPGTAWSIDGTPPRPAPPLPAEWRESKRGVVHVFTHFRLELDVRTATVPAHVPAPAGMWWSGPNRIATEALPTVMRKAIDAALA